MVMKALKVLGGIFGVILAAIFIFWFGWLRAPSPEAVCENMSKIMKKEAGTEMPAVEMQSCIQRLQPPEFGRLPYAKRMNCMEDAETFAELEKCE